MLNEEICLPRGLAGFPIAAAPDWSSYQEFYTPPSKPASPLGILYPSSKLARAEE